MATKQFSRLSSLVKNDNLAKAVAQCDNMLQDMPNDLEVVKTKCVSLIWLGKYAEAVESSKGIPELKFEHAYCLYRLNKLAECEQLLNGMQETAPVKHLKAQLCYRSGDFDKAAHLYSGLLGSSSASKKASRASREVLSNYLAAAIENGDSKAALDNVNGVESQSKLSQSSLCYELEYNRACALMQIGDLVAAEDALNKAHEVGAKVLEQDDLDAEEIESELAAVRVQKGYIQQLQGNENEAQKEYLVALKCKPASASTVAVASNNLFVARKQRDLFDSYKRNRQSSDDTAHVLGKMSPSERQTICFNRVLLLLYMNKSDECRESIFQLEKDFPDSEFPKIALAALYLQQKKNSKCEEVLKQGIEEAISVSNDVKTMHLVLALTQIYVTDGRVSDAIQAMERLPPSVSHAPAVVATLVALHERSGELEKCERVLSEAVSDCRKLMDGIVDESGNQEVASQRFFSLLVAQAEFYTRHQWFERAAKVFSALVDGEEGPIDASLRARALASLVIVLAKFDPEASEARAATLPVPESLDSLDPVELEKQVLPRDAPSVRSSKRRMAAEKVKDDNADKGVGSLKRNAQQLAALARRKEKKRAKYFNTLKARHGEDFDPASQVPDPDRWLPLAERASSGRRFRKKRGAKMTGGQGAGDLAARDAAKFDVREAVKQQREEVAKKVETSTGGQRKKKGKKKGKR